MTRRYRSAAVETLSGDAVTVRLVTPDDGDATILVSIDDVDDCVMPTADFRELLRLACVAARAGNVVTVS